MKSKLNDIKDGNITYSALMFECPGCAELTGSRGLHMLPVNTDKKSPSWSWNGSFDQPTLKPSIRTMYHKGSSPADVCHSFLTDGYFKFLDDSTHSLAGKTVEMPDLDRDNGEDVE